MSLHNCPECGTVHPWGNKLTEKETEERMAFYREAKAFVLWRKELLDAMASYGDDFASRLVDRYNAIK